MLGTLRSEGELIYKSSFSSIQILKKYEITILKLNKKVTKQIGLGVSSKTVFLIG